MKISNILFINIIILLFSCNLYSQSNSNPNYIKEDGTLPVELIYFQALPYPDAVLLRWGTATEVGNYGFEPQRALHGYPFETLGFVPGSGNSNSPKHYIFWDSTIAHNGIYHYRLKQLNLNGSVEYYDTLTLNYQLSDVSEANNENINSYLLFQNYPNPFNPKTVIKYKIPENSYTFGNEKLINLSVYDLNGKFIVNLVNDYQKPGLYEIEFDASNLSSGNYLYKLQVDNYILVRKMTIIK